ncbi:MAG: 1-acyl-sn-glycerol-3-phosphate acyltransferase [Chloroflexi bacterium]|nr:MAG: 1-acyl-sn-glycerol-3-phosphate acyltransferase [Chloroflexota bacterium]MBL1193020.1 1-acyl-sn-glycerol-3-phosphate acyltransferase [Chloroflexota bacterium]NOH10313.1 1-acyl-sn-glycerol-3-phosphate acyltransferase [Chloroflexota bacterium]
MSQGATNSISVRRSPIRSFMQWSAKAGFALLSRLKISGQENFPDTGPLIIVSNHFSFVDPAAIARVTPWPVEFIGGANFPHAPAILHFLPKLWGYYPVHRGTGSKEALLLASDLLKGGGVLGIAPEGGNWANVLRPPRPGAAFLASETGAKLLPIGLENMERIFPSLRKGVRARVHINVGKPFGPFKATGKGRERRKQLDEIGHEIMRNIAPLIPAAQRGHYSDDPTIRAAAKGTEVWPWDVAKEGEVKGKIQ